MESYRVSVKVFVYCIVLLIMCSISRHRARHADTILQAMAMALASPLSYSSRGARFGRVVAPKIYGCSERGYGHNTHSSKHSLPIPWVLRRKHSSMTFIPGVQYSSDDSVHML